MKKLFRNIWSQFLGHSTDGYFRVPDTPQDLPEPENDTPWAGTLKLSMEKFNKLTRKDGHGTPAFYAIVGLILAVITLVEFLIFYVESLGVLLIPIMLILSLMKFVIVVAFFMHLRFDNKIFTYLFFAGFILAAVISVALLVLLAIKP
ncbi:MAG: cytochrome C oxidase subunit IV family protein [Chloroflexota bacterium]|jgi:cytochrome c oxidase subunit 4|nr:cytochrome C oxidase subunit IV family protein [Chloroflexota bacterium]